MNLLVVHEVNYLSKIIYEFQILPELLSILGHNVVIVDYNDSWNTEPSNGRFRLRASIYNRVHRAYPTASVTVRRPGQIRAPVLARVSGAIAAGIEVARAMDAQRPDAVLLYGLPTIGVQTLLAARSRNIPVVFRAIDVTHQLVPSAWLVRPTKVLERFVFNSVDLNVALTPHLRDYILSYGTPERMVRLLPSGVDAEMFSPGDRNNALLARWGIGPSDPVILFMGTIYRFSGLDRVILDFHRVLARNPQAKLLIVGLGEDENRLKELAERTRLSGNVVFTGLQPYADLPDIIRSSDVCINPFELNGITRDILPTKLFQYMSCAKPVLATSLPGTRTFIRGSEDGVVFTELDQFDAELSAILSDSDRCRRLGSNGLRLAREYDWTSIAKTMESWLSEVS